MSTHKADDKKHEPAHAAHKKAPEVPRTKDGEIDVAKMKEMRREKPGEEPVPPEKREKRPAIVHPLPHVAGVKHEAGKDPEEVKDEMKAAGAPDVETPFPDSAAQELYALRKEGRLYRCRQEGLSTCLIEADDAEQARDAYVAEQHRLAGDEPDEKGKAAKKAPVAMPALPAGYVAVPIPQAEPSVKKELVKVTKLLP